MDIRESYNAWAAQYDTNHNRTRDLEGVALRSLLKDLPFRSCLEIGCGTGKNTLWLAQKAVHVTAVDFSEQMLEQARAKVTGEHVSFVKADVLQDWAFSKSTFELVTFSLVLEHVEHLAPVLRKAASVLSPGGHVYIGELHPFKQYNGSKARFETAGGQHTLTCYTHHISDFVQAANQSGLTVVDVQEYFDEGDSSGIPRILCMIFKKV